jgi:hypothetical protein
MRWWQGLDRLWRRFRDRKATMVYLVILRGDPLVVAEARGTVTQVSNGWSDVADGIMLVGLNTPIQPFRNFLSRHPGVEVVVLQVARHGWAAFGCDELANWLQAAAALF